MELTYGGMFEKHLAEQISGGGEIPRMVTLVNIFQGTDIGSRYSEFRNWVQGTSFSCMFCDDTFVPNPDKIKETNLVVCGRCRRKCKEYREYTDEGPAIEI